VDAGYDPLDYRYFLLLGHYRSQLQFSYEALDSARNARYSLNEKIRSVYAKADIGAQGPLPQNLDRSTLGEEAASHLQAFDTALEDDLSTPRALAELWGLLRDPLVPPRQILSVALDMDRVLGLNLAQEAQRVEPEVSLDQSLVEEIEALVAERSQAKKARDFAKADAIRSALQQRGVILEDGSEGTKWKLKGN
jgi:cysteinyl-tRNA synthetase